MSLGLRFLRGIWSGQDRESPAFAGLSCAEEDSSLHPGIPGQGPQPCSPTVRIDLCVGLSLIVPDPDAVNLRRLAELAVEVDGHVQTSEMLAGSVLSIEGLLRS